MNLDALCARCGYDIVQGVLTDKVRNGRIAKSDRAKLESTLTKGLGVLQEDGVYAFFLFLEYFNGRGESLGADRVVGCTMQMLRDPGVGLLRDRQSGEQDDFRALTELTSYLDNLLLARQLLEQALIYARYHAKALIEASEKTP